MIPEWNMSGILPVVRPGLLGNDSDRSPYVVNFSSVVETFGTTSERIEILNGLLRYRERLSEIGISNGFQWLDGSFVEDIESIEGRPPNDIDVVNFLTLPSSQSQDDLLASHPDIFRRKQSKEHYSVDCYFVELGLPMDPANIKLVSYWYSMWSQKRNGIPKGFVQIELSQEDDTLAREFLKSAKFGENK